MQICANYQGNWLSYEFRFVAMINFSKLVLLCTELSFLCVSPTTPFVDDFYQILGKKKKELDATIEKFKHLIWYVNNHVIFGSTKHELNWRKFWCVSIFPWNWIMFCIHEISVKTNCSMEFSIFYMTEKIMAISFLIV